MYNFALLALLAGTSSMIVGCDVKQHMEDVGFQKDGNVVEKTTAKYNILVDKDEACTAAWGDYEANLQRRADMIPQLVGIVKGSAAHEETTLVAIAQAQANATRPEVKLDAKAGDMEDPAKFAAFQSAQSTLGTQMSRLMVQAPAMYPQLAASSQFHDLQVQVEGTENRLLRSRETYNKVVMAFNQELRHVSGKILNPLTGHEFKPRIYFTADADAKVAPKIDFGATPASTAITPGTTK
jgi:LemA protein